MRGGRGESQWFPAQVRRPDPWGVLPSQVGELPLPHHAPHGIGAVAAPEGSLVEGQELGAFVPGHRVQVG